MSRDSYKGVPKVVDSFIDQDGNTRLRNGSGNNYAAYLVGSGTLSDGICTLEGSDLGITVGYHTMALVTSYSGSTPESRLEWATDVANNRIYISGTAADASKFGYLIINPGLATPKIS